ncbi:MAG: hypothetical protein U0694_18405, partial [Anaerolineae bacterium]
LVVNQIDLLKPNEQQEVRRFVENQTSELLGIQPLIFMVSAKEALNARRQSPVSGGATENGAAVVVPAGTGGIDAVRAHLRGVFSETSPAKQKLLTQLDTAERIISKHYDLVKGRADLVSADTSKVHDVQKELQQQAQGLSDQLRSARDNIDKVFDGIRQRGMTFIDEQLSIKRIGRTLNKETLQQEFQNVVIGRALRDVNEGTENYVNTVIDHSRIYWRGVIDRLNQLKDLMEQEVGGLDAGVYAEQRESLQEAIRLAEGELRSYSSGKVVGEIQDIFNANMNGFMMTSLAAFGGFVVTLIATVGTAGPVIGHGALPFALPGLILGAAIAVPSGVLAIRYLRRLSADTKRDFNQRVDQLVAKYHTGLDDLIQKERNRLTQYGNQVLTPIFSRLDVLAERYANQQKTFNAHRTQVETLRKGIQESK